MPWQSPCDRFPYYSCSTASRRLFLVRVFLQVSTAEEAALHKAISLQSDAGPDGCVLLLRAACILAPLLARLGGPMAATFAALHSSARSGEQQLLPPGVAIDAVGTVFPQAWW